MSKNNSYSTAKRTQILDYLIEHKDKDVTVKDIEEHITLTEGAKINVTTIYRYLDKLTREGKILKHTSETGNKSTFQYVEKSHQCHSHLHMRCSDCGKIYHMDCDFMLDFQNHIYEHHHFLLECKTSMLYGKCEKCAVLN